ncbi:MAG: hypothetical protein ACI9G1_000033 [Pirellulaceae bacterium]|jgi:hypothetical protein
MRSKLIHPSNETQSNVILQSRDSCLLLCRKASAQARTTTVPISDVSRTCDVILVSVSVISVARKPAPAPVRLPINDAATRSSKQRPIKRPTTDPPKNPSKSRAIDSPAPTVDSWMAAIPGTTIPTKTAQTATSRNKADKGVDRTGFSIGPGISRGSFTSSLLCCRCSRVFDLSEDTAVRYKSRGWRIRRCRENFPRRVQIWEVV